MESGSGRDCWQRGVNPATLVYRDKTDQNWIYDDDINPCNYLSGISFSS